MILSIYFSCKDKSRGEKDATTLFFSSVPLFDAVVQRVWRFRSFCGVSEHRPSTTFCFGRFSGKTRSCGFLRQTNKQQQDDLRKKASKSSDEKLLISLLTESFWSRPTTDFISQNPSRRYFRLLPTFFLSEKTRRKLMSRLCLTGWNLPTETVRRWFLTLHCLGSEIRR